MDNPGGYLDQFLVFCYFEEKDFGDSPFLAYIQYRDPSLLPKVGASAFELAVEIKERYFTYQFFRRIGVNYRPEQEPNETLPVGGGSVVHEEVLTLQTFGQLFLLN